MSNGTPTPPATLPPGSLGEFTGSQPEVVATENTVILWRLSASSVNPSTFMPVGPVPFTGIYSRIDQILGLAAGAVVAFFDNVAMRLYQATITAIDTTAKTITLNAPNAPTPDITLDYGNRDGSANLPITILA